jgi:hypothetical protein
MRKSLVALLSLSLLSAAGCGGQRAQQGSAALPDDESERRRAILERAWGPEPAERLETFLELRRTIQPRIEKHNDAIQQLALRHAATRPVVGKGVFGVGLVRADLERALREVGLEYSDYMRLTALVYGRWLRAVRDQPPPEKRVIRALQEMEIGIERRLANNPPEDPKKAHALQERLRSVRHQIEFLEPYGAMDPETVLERIHPDTRAWLEEHRQEIEELDFVFFDTAPPPRTRSRGHASGGEAGAPAAL